MLVLALGSCGGSSGGGGGGVTLNEGQLVAGANGFYFVDANERGRAPGLHLAETYWARLVDLYDVDGLGIRSQAPIQTDLPIDPNLAEDGIDYRFESGVSGVTRLVILYPRTSADFERSLRNATQALPVLQAKAETSPAPFSLLARNAAIVLRFDDLLDDSDDALFGLSDSVRTLVGYPPTARFGNRVLFDASHGGDNGTGFHSTRVIVDLTTSPAEGAESLGDVNLVGLPASLTTTQQANVTIRLATREDFATSHFFVVRNLRGRPLDPTQSGPTDPTSTTLDVVRSVRSGNPSDPNNGFLMDEIPPRLVGRWFALIQTAAFDPLVPDEILLRLAFQTACRKALEVGDLIETSAAFLEVIEATGDPDPDGVIPEVRVRALGSEAVLPVQLVGGSNLLTQFDEDSSADPACFIEVLDAVSLDPGADIRTGASFRLRFNEPMDPDSFDPLESVLLFSGASPTATTTVVGTTTKTGTADTFTFAPTLPLSHVQGSSETYSFEFGGAEGASDLAGNPLDLALPQLMFHVAASQPTSPSGGLSFRFRSLNEYVVNDPAPNSPDLRGSITLDTDRGVLVPRPVARGNWPIDGSTPITALMTPLGVQISEPLIPLGSRFQTLWRYADIGWQVEDESKFDLDVEGIAWKPFFSGVNNDFIENFEVRLGHATQLPDEIVNAMGVLQFPGSGLLDAPAHFDDNVLEASGARPINERSEGYRIEVSKLFTTNTGSTMMPYPLSTDLPPFTWRDTSLQGTGGLGGQGIPLGIEKMVDPSVNVGSVAPAGLVPSFGLPLLIEIRCFPSATSFGANGHRVAIPALGQLFPSFRVHSSGGLNTLNVPSPVDPDLAEVPQGGFDPASNPPGLPTRSADPAFYFGNLDTVVRVTRVFTVWFDSGSSSTDYFEPLVSPAPSGQPAGTEVRFAYRGATGFQDSMDTQFDANDIDAYGELKEGNAVYPDGIGAWSDDIDDVDGLRFLQVRITFLNNVDTGLSPELDSLAFPFLR